MALKNLYKYAIIGLLSALIDVILFAFFFDFIQRGLFFSNAISVSSAAIFSFSINSFYNFKKSDYLLLRLGSFVAVITAGYFVGILIILFSMQFIGLSGLYSKFISLPFVFFFQYFLNSRISFR